MGCDLRGRGSSMRSRATQTSHTGSLVARHEGLRERRGTVHFSGWVWVSQKQSLRQGSGCKWEKLSWAIRAGRVTTRPLKEGRGRVKAALLLASKDGGGEATNPGT